MPGMAGMLKDLLGEQGAEAGKAAAAGSLWRLCWVLPNICVLCSRLATSCTSALQLSVLELKT